MEDYARILDFLPQGHPDQSKFHREPLAYALGVDEFKLFELVPKEGVGLSVGQRVYIGKEVDMRAEVLHVKRRVGYEELTTAAQKELPFVIAETVKEKEDKFVDFFNRAQRWRSRTRRKSTGCSSLARRRSPAGEDNRQAACHRAESRAGDTTTKSGMPDVVATLIT